MSLAEVAVRVLVPGVYADKHMRALPYADEGDIITIASGWYVDECFMKGMISLVLDPEDDGDGEPNTASGSTVKFDQTPRRGTRKRA